MRDPKNPFAASKVVIWRCDRVGCQERVQMGGGSGVRRECPPLWSSLDFAGPTTTYVTQALHLCEKCAAEIAALFEREALKQGLESEA